MAPAQALEIRPRTTGEILDDAWRLYFADAPRLLLLHGLFHVPAFSLLLVLAATQPAWLVVRLLLTLLAALALPLTGLGSGAVQERLRRLAENRDATLAECVGAALWRGLEHAAVRAMLLVACALVLPGLVLWPVAATLPTLAADGKGLWANLGRVGRETWFDPAKACGVVYSRLPLVLMAFVNAHLLVQVALWAAQNLGGFDLALLDFQLSLGNPVYDLALFLAVWLLLAPYFEASNYLLYLDTRTRQEGLDLLYRVRRAFGAADPKRAAAVLAAVAAWLFGAASVPAAPPGPRLDTVREVRQEVEKLQQQVEAADPYRNGGAVEGRLRELGARLEGAPPPAEKRFPWYWEAVAGFGEKPQGEAARTLGELAGRLTLLEETLRGPPEGGGAAPPPSKEEVKKLLRERNDSPPGEKKKPPEDIPDHVEVKHKDGPDGSGGGGPSGGPGVSVPAAPAGLGYVCLYVFAGLALAALVAGLVLFFVNLPKRERRAAPETGQSAITAETVEQLHQHPVAELLRRADALAERGQHLEGLRTAYLAVLSLLHRKQLLRYEPTRTNGEYVREVRLAAHAPAALHEPFDRLTWFFEVKWYGERACDARDYDEARALVGTIQNVVGAR
jgi:hypothetical protein